MDELRAGLTNGSTEKSVESNKTNILNEFNTLPPNLKESAQYDWQQLTREEITFERRDKAREAIKKVTA